MRNLNFQSLYKLTVFLIFATLATYILIVGQSVIVPLVIAFFIAFLLIPLCTVLERIHFPRVLAAITSIIVAIVVLLGFFTLLGSQVSRFTKDMDEITSRLKQIRTRLPDVVNDQLSSVSVDEIITWVQQHLGDIFTNVSSFFGSFSVVFIVPIYIALILIYRDLLKEFVFRVFNAEHQETEEETEITVDDDARGIRTLVPKIRLVIQKYITGMFYVIIILFILYSTALTIIGIEHAILFAAIAASLNVIPFVGPFLGSSLPILFAFITKDSLAYPAAVFGSFIVIQAVEGNFLTPKIVGNNVSLNPFVTLVTLIVGASIWGLIGMILFIPIIAIIKEILNTIDGMEAYAFVLGNPDDDEIKKTSGLKTLLEKVKGFFSKNR